jgi:hypothetical protein
MKAYALSKKSRILMIPAVLLLIPLAARAEAPAQNGNLVPFFMHIRAGSCSITDPAVGMVASTTPTDALLFDRNNAGGNTVFFCNPVLAPDGHQLTLEEFTAVQGTAKVKCIGTGTHSVLHYSGLVPNGTYTVWLFLVNPSGTPPYLGAGSLGRTDPSENFFTASAAGEGQIVRTTPEEDLSAFGHVGPCFLDGAVEVHLVYHIDGMTHGHFPGPNETWVTNARFFFP